jgi:hypothetical protein
LLKFLVRKGYGKHALFQLARQRVLVGRERQQADAGIVELGLGYADIGAACCFERKEFRLRRSTIGRQGDRGPYPSVLIQAYCVSFLRVCVFLGFCHTSLVKKT